MAKKHAEKITEVPGIPAKTFFVSMLTRDIELQDAILDLLDNCVDGALRSRSKAQADRDSLDGFWAAIMFNEKRFSIEDNCGGIPWVIAEKYAFMMGRPANVKEEEGTIGVVGIGMKRAIFKLGRESTVISEHKDDSFMVSIPESWFDDDNDDWTFKAERTKPKLDAHGTLLEVDKLLGPVSIAFKAGSSFESEFAHIVAEAYSYLIEKGFKVTVNGVIVERRPIRLCAERPRGSKQEKLLNPFIYLTEIDEVNVFLVVGYRSALVTREQQDSENEVSSYSAKDAGWTIVCNDRVVLSADRSIKTGWGAAGVPQFHNQFSSIAGIVEFESKHTSKLPVTTTKRGIDPGKDIYVRIRPKMQEALKHFTTNTNRWKEFESELKARFDDRERMQYLDLRELKMAVQNGVFPLRKLAGPNNGQQFKPDLPERTKVDTTKNICFRKEISDIAIVSNFIFGEVREPREVGEACFDNMLDEAKK